jgi:hypothetical protein
VNLRELLGDMGMDKRSVAAAVQEQEAVEAPRDSDCLYCEGQPCTYDPVSENGETPQASPTEPYPCPGCSLLVVRGRAHGPCSCQTGGVQRKPKPNLKADTVDALLWELTNAHPDLNMSIEVYAGLWKVTATCAAGQVRTGYSADPIQVLRNTIKELSSER